MCISKSTSTRVKPIAEAHARQKVGPEASNNDTFTPPKKKQQQQREKERKYYPKIAQTQ